MDTGCIVAFEESVSYEIKFVGGFKNALFGGEGLFLAVLQGPGKTILQTLPFSRLAGRIMGTTREGTGGDERIHLGVGHGRRAYRRGRRGPCSESRFRDRRGREAAPAGSRQTGKPV